MTLDARPVRLDEVIMSEYSELADEVGEVSLFSLNIRLRLALTGAWEVSGEWDVDVEPEPVDRPDLPR